MTVARCLLIFLFLKKEKKESREFKWAKHGSWNITAKICITLIDVTDVSFPRRDNNPVATMLLQNALPNFFYRVIPYTLHIISNTHNRTISIKPSFEFLISNHDFTFTSSDSNDDRISSHFSSSISSISFTNRSQTRSIAITVPAPFECKSQ